MHSIASDTMLKIKDKDEEVMCGRIWLCFSKQKLLNETDTSASPLLYPVYQLGLAHNQQHGLKLFPSGV